MGKFIIRLFLTLLIISVSIIIFLSYFGLETDKFDSLIKNKTNEVSRHIKLGFNKTKIHLNLAELNLIVRLQNPKILIKKDEINLSKLNLFLPLRSFFTSGFLLKRAEVAFVKNDVKDIMKITNIFVPKILNNQLNKIFLKGNLEGEFIIPFESDGSIGKDYGFSGKISNALINLTKDFSIKNLTTEISHVKDTDSDGLNIIIEEGFVYNLELAGSTINLKRTKNETKIKSLIHTNGKFNPSQIKKILLLLDLNTNDFKNINGTADLKTNIDFDLDKKFKIKNLSYTIEGNASYFEMQTKEKIIVKKYFPKYNPKIILKDTKIKFTNSKFDQALELNGLIKIKDHFDNFKIREVYNYDKNNFNIKGIIDLTNSEVKVSKLNYTKDSGKKSEISFDTNFVLDKYYNIKNLKFLEDKTQIYLSDIKLNKNFEVKDFKKLEIKTFTNGIKNNDFLIKKPENVIILGEVFDAQPLLKSLYVKSDRRIFSKNFISEITINFDKALSGTSDDVSDFAMIASIKKGSYDKLSLKGNFSENEIIEISIYQVDKDEKMIHVISDRAKPFVKNFNFIKGFKGGKLEYESIISKQDSKSTLTITDFNVSKVPALAKLLTLASLQGIADTLSGEGINFEIFEMKFDSKDNILDIEEAYASGPAVSILFDGYVDKGKIVSLNGTLVQARWLNSIINKIPIVGKILVGKKTGEGVVGVSFKMKGSPKDIKTSVNPIKTITPRFIVRAVEKMKKQKKEKIK